MPTNLAIDDEVLEQALAIGGHRTKRETVNEALREYIQRRQRLQLVKLVGKVELRPEVRLQEGAAGQVILFDTSVLSRVFRRRRPGAEERRLQVLFEWADGERCAAGPARNRAAGGPQRDGFTEAVCGTSWPAPRCGFTVLPASTDEHVEAARLKNLCMSKGLNVSGIDCLIATTAIAGGHELFAVDGDFGEISKHSALRLFSEPDAA